MQKKNKNPKTKLNPQTMAFSKSIITRPHYPHLSHAKIFFLFTKK